MKILSITIQNIQSIGEPVTIPFHESPFSEEGIFLICGPTGAGKSTILDAINLALFKETPRTGGKLNTTDINEQGLVITRGALSARAEVIYEMDPQRRFKSEFKAERTARSQGFGSGHLKMNLSQWDGADWQLVTDREAEVISQNTANIGLNANQFRMAVLLAQGEFAKLLKAEASERAFLLEKITGKGIFRQIGRKIFEKHQTIKKELETAQTILGNIKLLSSEEIAQLQQSLDESIALSNTLEAEMQRMRTELQWWENHRELSNKKDKRKQTLADKFLLQQKFSAVSEPLSRHEKAEKFVPALQMHRQQTQKIDLQKKQLVQWAEDQKKLQNGIIELKTTIEGLKNNFLTQTDWIGELEEKKGHAQIEKDHIKSLQNEIDLVKSLIAELVGRWNWSHATPSSVWESWKSETEALFQSMNISANDLEVKVQDCHENLQKSQKWLETESLWAEKNAQFLQAELKIGELKTQEQQISESLKGPKEKWTKAQKSLEATQLEIQGLQKIADASQIRATLEEGKPCVVCGSTEHPFAHQPFDDALKKKNEELETMNLEVSKWSQKVVELETKILENNQNSATLLGQCNTLKTDQVSLEKSLESQKMNAFESAELAVKFYQNQWEQLQAAREKVQQYQQLLRAVPHYQKLPVLQSEMELATQRYFQTYPTNFLGEVDAWLTSIHSKREQISNLEVQQVNLRNEITKGERDIHEHHKNLLVELKKVGFPSMEEAEAAWKTGDEIREWRQWKSNLESLEPLLQALEQEIQERELKLSQQPQPALSELEIKQALDGRGTALREAIFHQGKLQTEIKNDHESRANAGSKLEEIQSINEKLKHWSVLNSAFGDSDGNKFSKIAQQYTLDLLIQIANKKLESFKARYILKQEKHLKGDSHLVVVDQYLGNQIRSVDTLSGGEMFLTSLALAMALSEFAAQNAQLNTLFIDEGFGTLDPDSLNAAMEAIDSIRRQSKKMIGLISHVQELRERIHCQIEVNPQGNGLSSIEIRPKRT